MNELMGLLLIGARVTDVLPAVFPGDLRIMVKWRFGLRRGWVIM